MKDHGSLRKTPYFIIHDLYYLSKLQSTYSQITNDQFYTIVTIQS